MARLVSLLTSALSALVVSGAVQSASAEAQPPAPPPHVVIVRTEQGDERILYREGWRRREVFREENVFMVNISSPDDLRYGMVFRQERATGLNLSRTPISTFERSPTQAVDTVLGERCAVWSREPELEERIYGGPVIECITSDGIVLWVGRDPPSGQRIYARATNLERRPIDWTEIVSTREREAMNWAYWSHNFPIPQQDTPAYEIRGVLGRDVVERVRGELVQRGFPGGSLQLRNSGASMTYNAPNMGHTSIIIEIAARRPWPQPLEGGSEPMDRPALNLLGETCRWHRIDLRVRWGIVSRCVTDDGIALVSATDFHDDRSQTDEYFAATHFRRGAPSEALMMPPPGLFDPWIAALPN